MDNRIQTKTSDQIQQDASETRPYAPSFIDRFIGFVDQLPCPYWLTYLVLIILQSSVVHVLAWIDGWLSAYVFSPILLLYPLWLWGPLAIMTYLNSISVEALSSFRPLLDVEEERLRRVKYEFTTMPARSVILSCVIWSIVYVILVYLNRGVFAAYGMGTFFTLILLLEGLLSFSTASAIYYHSLRQLRLVNRTVRMVKKVNLFQIDPVYAFSRVTSRTGISWMIMLSLTLLTFPVELTNVPVLAILVLQVLLALAAFVLPLRFVNQYLVSEKRSLVAELNQRVERTLERLHRHLDENELGEVAELNEAITALNAERDILTSIPTWPWRAGTLTGFLSALILPIILFLLQLVLEKLLGG
jgi:hypothetical protein